MAAPTVRGRTAPAAGLSATSPAGTAIGDAVIVFTWEQVAAGAPTHTLQSGFVEVLSHLHDDSNTDGRLSVAYKIATSAGAVSYQAYTSSSGTTVRTGIVVLTVGTHSLGTTQKGGATAAGATLTTNAVPNPPSLTLGNTRDWLVLAIAGWHLGSAATVTPTAPTNYSNLQHVSGSSASEVASAERGVTAAASEDPGTFGDDVAPNGTASITAGFPNPRERTAAIDGVGAITVAATFFSILERSAAVGATGLIAVAGESETPVTAHERSASLAATGAIESAATFFSVFERSSALDAAGSVTVAAFVRELVRSTSLAATGAVTIADTLTILSRSSSVGATAGIAVSATFFSTLERSASLSATAGIATGRLVEAHRSASLSATAGLEVAGEIAGAVQRSASLNAVGTISAAGRNIAQSRSASLAGVGLIAVSGGVVEPVERSAALNAVASIAVSGAVIGTEILEFPVGRAPILAGASSGRLVLAATPGLEVGSLDVPVLASAGGGRILDPDDPRLEVP